MISFLKSVPLFLLCTFFLTHNASAQNTVESDTVVIKKDPVVIIKKVYIEKEKRKQKNRHRLEISIAPIKHTSNFNQDFNHTWDDYFYMINLDTYSEPLVGYSIGLSYSYLLKNIYIHPGLSLTNYRERFTDYNSTLFVLPEETINNYTYLEAHLCAGYRFNIKKFSVTPYAGFILGTMLSARGKTISPEDRTDVVNLSDANLYTSSAQSLSGGLKIMFRLSETVELALTPFYREDIKSITQSQIPFSLRRSVGGLQFGVAYNL
jgi:hypothetical protein